MPTFTGFTDKLPSSAQDTPGSAGREKRAAHYEARRLSSIGGAARFPGLKCQAGELVGRLWPRDDEERRRALDAGYDLDRVLTVDDLVAGENVFFAATGVTDGELLRGVRFDRRGSLTQSLSMRSKSGTSRQIEARHQLSKLSRYASIDYG